jgi:hypothetical protein
MIIKFDKATLEIDLEEANTLYSTLKHGIEDRINCHWRYHPDAYEEMESQRLHMMRELARFTGRDFAGDSAELRRQTTTAARSKTPTPNEDPQRTPQE